jgi:hypothetical protein
MQRVRGEFADLPWKSDIYTSGRIPLMHDTVVLCFQLGSFHHVIAPTSIIEMCPRFRQSPSYR